MTQEKSQTKEHIPLIKVIRSVAASFFGVQSKQQHEEDFTKGKPVHYIVVGLIGTVLFIVILLIIVNFVLSLNSPS